MGLIRLGGLNPLARWDVFFFWQERTDDVIYRCRITNWIGPANTPSATLNIYLPILNKYNHKYVLSSYKI